MERNDHLFNAAVIGENPETAYLAENNRLHAVEQAIADQKKDKSDPKLILPLMREGLKALVDFSQGKVESHFLDIDWKTLENQDNEASRLVEKIHQIYTHLPHHDRNSLSSLIHHKQTS